MNEYTRKFFNLALQKKALLFGDFTTKAGRQSPYFFNIGAFADGESLNALAHHYRATLEREQAEFDMVFGPAYKGIPLAVALALAYVGKKNIPFAFNRKEAKDHGEGGVLIGAPLQGKVLIVDDVLSAGTSVAESMAMIDAHGAKAAGVVVALDRMEKGKEEMLARLEVAEKFGIPVYAIMTLAEIMAILEEEGQNDLVKRIKDYLKRHGS